jgi:hypothetical protein
MLGERLLRVYQLKEAKTVRLVGGVYHDRKNTLCFKWVRISGYETQFKLMLVVLTPWACCWLLMWRLAIAPTTLCMRLVINGKTMLAQNGLLVVGDSKMSALSTRATIVAGNDYYLTPLPQEKGEAVGLLDEYLRQLEGKEHQTQAGLSTRRAAG